MNAKLTFCFCSYKATFFSFLILICSCSSWTCWHTLNWSKKGPEVIRSGRNYWLVDQSVQIEAKGLMNSALEVNGVKIIINKIVNCWIYSVLIYLRTGIRSAELLLWWSLMPWTYNWAHFVISRLLQCKELITGALVQSIFVVILIFKLNQRAQPSVVYSSISPARLYFTL